MSEDDADGSDPPDSDRSDADPDDEDWFERALAGEETEAGRDDEPDGGDVGSTDDADGSMGGEATAETDEFADGFDAADPDSDELDAAFEAATRAAAGDDEGETEDGGDGTDADGDAFGSASEDVGADEFGSGRDDVAGGAGGDLFGDDDFGLGRPSDTGDPFADDVGSAFGGGDRLETFDEDSFDSEIPRLDLGIGGLDRMIRGGVPERHLLVVVGSAGTGKTTFGLQYLNHGLQAGENCVFITLEQSHQSILDTAAEYGWDFERYEADDQLAVVDLDPVEMANSLDNIRDELPALIEDFDADRFVLDSVSLLEMMYDEQARRRTEIFDFTRSLKNAGVTTLLTSEADENNPYASRHGIIEYLTDAVFVLQYVREESRETRLAVEIQKIRNANHSREAKPYEITDAGISVYEQANIF